MRLILVSVCTLLALTSASQAREPMQSTYTNLALKSCPKTPRNGPVSDHQAVTYRCPGPGGMTISMVFFGAYLDVTFSGGGLKPWDKPIRAEYGVGEKLEWRGTGAAPAQAGILRLRRWEGKKLTGDVLAVLARDGSRICVAAVIDAAAVPRANEIARRSADETIGAGFRCGTDAPQIIGPATDRAIAARDNNL